MTPSEFKLFGWGRNDTDRGTCILDRDGARAILARQGARDVMIDREHLSLELGPGADLDACGWGRLDVRDDGLWLVDVRWTEKGRACLDARTQRYVSPTFVPDERGRVIAIVNVALTSLPAMRHLPALVAASIRKKQHMNILEQLSELASLVESGAAHADIESAYASLGEAIASSLPPEAEESAGMLEEAAAAASEAAAVAEGETDEEMDALEEMAASKGYRLTRMGSDEEPEAMSGEVAEAEAMSARLARLEKRLAARERKPLHRPVKLSGRDSASEEDRRVARSLGLSVEKVVAYRQKFQKGNVQ